MTKQSLLDRNETQQSAALPFGAPLSLPRTDVAMSMPPPYPPPLPAHFYFYSGTPAYSRHNLSLARHADASYRYLFGRLKAIDPKILQRVLAGLQTKTKAINSLVLSLLILSTVYASQLLQVIRNASNRLLKLSNSSLATMVVLSQKFTVGIGRLTFHRYVTTYMNEAAYTPHKAFISLGLAVAILTLVMAPFVPMSFIGLFLATALIQVGVGLVLKTKSRP